jgi:hypothetical protein
VAAREDFVEQLIVGRDIAAEHFAGERVLVLEVVEEAALGEAGFGDHFLDRSGAKSLGEYGGFRDLENSLARCLALSHPLLQNCTHGTVSPLPTVRRFCASAANHLNSYHFAASRSSAPRAA